jgi:choline dehydrogenase-like flavoprotein
MAERGEIIEGYKEKSDREVEADLCVVGSGPGGSVVAYRVASSGKKVVLLERGGYYSAERGDFDQREDHMMGKIDGGDGLHYTEDGGVLLLYGNCVGGATVHYWADTYRTPKDRLELWEKEYGVEFHTEEELLPHFERIEKDLHVEPAPDHLLNGLNVRLERALKTLGWEGERVPQARLNCIGSGYCFQGCAYNAKRSALVTYIPMGIEKGVTLFSDTEAVSLLREGNRITALRASFLSRRSGKPTGFHLTVKAKAFVIACGGFETPAFLLRNRFRHPALGSRLFCNPTVMVHGLFPEKVNQYRGIPAGIGCTHFRLKKVSKSGKYLEGGYMLMPNQLQAGMFSAVLPGFGEEHNALMERFPYLGGTIAWIDDENPGSVWVDSRGVPRYSFPLGKEDRLKLWDAMVKGAIWLFTAGAEKVFLGDTSGTVLSSIEEVKKILEVIRFRPGEVTLAGPHPSSGTPMGKDPKRSVVDSRHRVYGVENLYIGDSSVFPTPVSVDPSETIMAFSHRLADFLEESL